MSFSQSAIPPVSVCSESTLCACVRGWMGVCACVRVCMVCVHVCVRVCVCVCVRMRVFCCERVTAGNPPADNALVSSCGSRLEFSSSHNNGTDGLLCLCVCVYVCVCVSVCMCVCVGGCLGMCVHVCVHVCVCVRSEAHTSE